MSKQQESKENVTLADFSEKEVQVFIEKGLYNPNAFRVEPFDENLVDKDLSNVVVISGLPPLKDESVVAKLKSILHKTFSQKDESFREEDIEIPFNEETGKFERFAFLTFSSSEHAATVKKLGDTGKVKIGKKEAVVDYFDEVQRNAHTPDEFSFDWVTFWGITPRIPLENPYFWLLDPRCREMLLVKHDNMDVDLLWSDEEGVRSDHSRCGRTLSQENSQPELGETRNFGGQPWKVQWSPRGTYLITHHEWGVKLWAGPRLKHIQSFRHPQATQVAMSPDERFIVTWSGDVPLDRFYAIGLDPAMGGLPPPLMVWDVLTGFHPPNMGLTKVHPEDMNIDAHWSPSSKYLARLLESRKGDRIENKVCVWEAPLFQDVVEELPAGEDTSGLSWSPTQDTLAWWTPPGVVDHNKPAMVVLRNVPSEKPRSANIGFNVYSGELIWHPQGEYLMMVARRLPKKQMKAWRKERSELGRSMAEVAQDKRFEQFATSSIHIFRVKDRGLPVENIELEEPVLALEWEPKGSRFAVITGRTSYTRTVSVYNVEGGKGVPEMLYSLKDRPHDQVKWSPTGRYFILTSEGRGEVEFRDAEDAKYQEKGTHFDVNTISWDPSGRVVVTAKTMPLFAEDVKGRDVVENSYTIWNFMGKLLVRQPHAELFQVAWRPRPPLMLTDEQIKQLEDPKYLEPKAEAYAQEAELLSKAEKYRHFWSKKQALDEFENLVSVRKGEWEEEKPARNAIGVVADEDNENIEVTEIEEDVTLETVVEEVTEDLGLDFDM